MFRDFALHGRQQIYNRTTGFQPIRKEPGLHWWNRCTHACIEETKMSRETSGATADSTSSPRWKLLLIVLLVALAAGIAVWRFVFAAPKTPENVVALSGRIEGDDSVVAPKTSGRIAEIRFREGDSVKTGDIIAVLDDEQIRAREEQARAGLAVNEAREHAARSQLAMLEAQLEQSQIQIGQAKTDAEGRVRQAEAEVASAEAELAQQEASLKLALFDRDAYTRLAQTGAVSERQGKQAVTTAEQQTAVVAAARRRVEAAKGALTTARANLDTPNIRVAQESAVRKQILQQEAEITAAVASANQSRFALTEAQANRQDLIVRAPFDGTVITRSAEPGEVVQAGTALVTLLDLSKVYLRGFVPEGQIGTVKVGQPARVYLDSKPNEAIDAYVLRVDPEATFTPENTYFREDRVKQVVGVKLQLKGAIGFAKPGMAADGEILIHGDQWPKQRRS
jgi:HlyD family secretion protein